MSLFKSTIDTLSKKHTDALAARQAADVARDKASQEEDRVRTEVESRSRGGVTAPTDQLAVVLSQIAHLEAEDAARRAECELSLAAMKLAVARKEPDALARDPETLLRDLSKIRETIVQHETALTAARQAWSNRMHAAHVSLVSAEESAQGGGARPLPLPAMTDEIGRGLSGDDFVEALRTMVERRFVPASSAERLRVLRARENELRVTIERHRVEEDEREKWRRRFVETERARHEDSARTTAEHNAEVARTAAEENARLAAAHRARVA